MVLVIGETGTVGSQVVRELATHPVETTVVCKSGLGDRPVDAGFGIPT